MPGDMREQRPGRVDEIKIADLTVSQMCEVARIRGAFALLEGVNYLKFRHHNSRETCNRFHVVVFASKSFA
jgi:hypothetical protein